MSPRLEPSVLESAIAGNSEMLRQLIACVGLLTEEQYRWEFNRSSGSIGKHTRHIVDHYLCLFAGVEKHEVNYDARARDTLLETNPKPASEAMDQMMGFLDGMTLDDPHARLFVVSSTDAAIAALTTASTVARELVFLQSHTIHHMALIRILLELQRIDVSDSFGFSPSTLKLEQRYG